MYYVLEETFFSDRKKFKQLREFDLSCNASF